MTTYSNLVALILADSAAADRIVDALDENPIYSVLVTR